MNPKAVKKHICEELAHGKPVQTILKPPVPAGDPQPDLPDWNIVVQWLKEDEVFRSDYEHAMKYGATYLADEMLLLKDRVIANPKDAPALKAAMDMIKWATMIRDPKYSERTMLEIKNNIPQDAEVVAARIKQLRMELGMEQGVVDVIATEVKPKRTAKQIAHYARLKALNTGKHRGKPTDS